MVFVSASNNKIEWTAKSTSLFTIFIRQFSTPYSNVYADVEQKEVHSFKYYTSDNTSKHKVRFCYAFLFGTDAYKILSPDIKENSITTSAKTFTALVETTFWLSAAIK